MEVGENNSVDIKIVSQWLKKFKLKILSKSDFYDYWNNWVPHILKSGYKDGFIILNVDIMDKFVCDSLEEFICDGNNIELLQMLLETSRNSKCGRIFKMGEPTYNCQECEIESTCVLCADCFTHSSHKYHKYKLGTSYGNGFCDCGDIKAWKRDAFCETHNLGLQKKSLNKDLMTKDMKERVYLVFEYVLHYARLFLTLSNIPSFTTEISSIDGFYHININREDYFCVVIYNKNNLTYDQLLHTFINTIKCSREKSVGLITLIEKEGRLVVMYAKLDECKKLKREIEIFSLELCGKVLNSKIVHSQIIAHQLYALKLLKWMQNLLRCSELRAIFSSNIITLSGNRILEYILQKDSSMWQSARLSWHKLFISGMLMEDNCKVHFANVFSNNYKMIMKNYINNDYDYIYSIASLSVHIFTVPSIAKHLIVHHKVLQSVLSVFSQQCLLKLDSYGKLNFEDSYAYNKFKKSQIIFKDIIYLLGDVPDKWSLDLKKSFCTAVFVFIKILNYMHNMYSIERQNDKHGECDTEWDVGFNLYIKLRPLITKILLWCGSDEIVLKKVYKMTKKKIFEYNNHNHKQTRKNLIGYEVNCVEYDVSHRPLSIHIPLYRFLAGLHLYVENYSCINNKWNFPKPIIEQVLCVLVLKAQVIAGIRKRNGCSLLNQIYLYSDTKCRMEMLDKDIVTLQIGASSLDSNHFLIHVINRFNLLQWADNNFECNLLTDGFDKHTIIIIEEFLTLIINIISERYSFKIGKVTFYDCLKKKVIQQLCIQPMSYSELHKKLLDIEHIDRCLERILNEVAVFNMIGGKCVYNLKPIFYQDYNVFFYHYSRNEMIKSEERQRKQKKEAGELDCCPPPSLPPFNNVYAKISDILICDVMFHIMKLILDRALNLDSKSFSEGQLHRVLHLIGYALYEEEKQHLDSFNFTENSKKYDIESKLDELRRSPRIEDYKDLIKWTLNKFRQVSSSKKIRETIKGTDDIENLENKKVELEKQNRVTLAKKRRGIVMAQMTQMQKKFMQNNRTLFDQIPTHSKVFQGLSEDKLGNIIKSKIPNNLSDNRYTCILCQEDQLVTCDSKIIGLAAYVQKSNVLNQLRSINISDPYYIPLYFGPSPHISTCGHAMHIDCWKQYFDRIKIKEESKVYRLRHTLSFDVTKNEYLCPLCSGLCNTVLPLLPPISGSTQSETIQVLEHLTFKSWFEGLKSALYLNELNTPNAQKYVYQYRNQKTEQRQTPARRDTSLQAQAPSNLSQIIISQAYDQQENNIMIFPNQFSIPYSNYLKKIIILYNCKNETIINIVPVYKTIDLPSTFSSIILEFSRITCSVATGLDYLSFYNPVVPLMIWKTCAYTIHSIEVILRYENKSLFGDLNNRQKQCIETLVRISVFLSSVWENKQDINIHALRFLSIVIDNGGDNSIGILDWDAFGMLVSLSMTLPSLYYSNAQSSKGSSPRGTVIDFHILRLMLIANLIQIILTIDIEEDNGEFLDLNSEEAKDTQCLIKLVYKLRGIHIKNSVAVWNLMKSCSIPFLRCCSLFYHFITGVSETNELKVVNGDTYYNMCNYLGLPTTCEKIFNEQYVDVVINTWATNDKLISIKKGKKVIKNWKHINELIKLPDNYSNLLNTTLKYTCPNKIQAELTSPAMCLVCGTILCSLSYCCQVEFNHSNHMTVSD